MNLDLSIGPDDPGKTRSDSTRERLLDAAAESFAEHGYAGTSIRAITHAARVSVSAANYHFGSKRALLQEAIQRSLDPLNREREAAIQKLVAVSSRPSVEEILRAFLSPLFAAPVEQRARYRKLVNRLYTEPPERVAELKQEVFGPLARVVVDALALALPDHPRAEVAMAFQVTLGVIIHFTGGHIDHAPGLDLSARPGDVELSRRLPAFCAAGLIAYLESGEASR